MFNSRYGRTAVLAVFLLVSSIFGCKSQEPAFELQVIGTREFTMTPAAFGDVGYRPSASFSEDGHLLAFAQQDSKDLDTYQVQMVSINSGENTQSRFQIARPNSRPVQIQFALNRPVLATRSGENVEVWDIQQGTKISDWNAFEKLPDKQRYLALNAPGKLVVTSWWKEYKPRGMQPYREPGLWVFDAETGEPLVELEGSDEDSYQSYFAFHPSENILFGTVKTKRGYRPCQWDAGSGKLLVNEDFRQITEATAFSFAPSQDLQATAYWNSKSNTKAREHEYFVVISQLGEFAEKLVLKHNAFVFWMAFSSKNDLLATVDANSNLQIWSATSGKLVQSISMPGASEVCWSPEDDLLVLRNSESKKHAVELLTLRVK